MDKGIDYTLLRAFELLKENKGFKSNYALCKYLDVPQGMLSTWINKPGSKIRGTTWDKFKAKVEPFIKDPEDIEPSDEIIAVLNKYSSLEDDSYIMAALAQEIVDLKKLVDKLPLEALETKGNQRKQLAIIMKAFAEAL